jgi:heme/copper-type cytochrome/quinol oxidase subunit 1
MSETSNESALKPPPVEDPTLVGLVGTTDHKRIGRMFITCAVLFGVGSVVLETLLRIDLTDPDAYVLFDSQTYTQSFLLARDALLFLFVIPLFIGIAIYVVPLQVGAANIMFPRAALAAFWTWLISSGILVGAYLGNGGPFGGNTDGVDLHLLSLGFTIAALLVAASTVVTTALTLRAPGLYLDAVPAFTWASIISGVGLLMTLPVLLGNLVFLYIDHRYGRVFLGGNHGVWDNVEFAYRAPMLFLYAVPALGAAAEILQSAAKRRVMVPMVVTGGLGAVGVFGLGAWAQLNLAEGAEVTNGWPGVVYLAMFVGALLGIVMVVAMSLGTLGSTKSLPSLSAPVLAAIATSILLVLGALQAATGTFLDWAESLDWWSNDPAVPLRDTVWVSAQFQILIIGVGVIGAIGALSWWAPKIWGRSLNGVIGRLAVALGFIGTVAAAVGTSVAAVVSGQPELPRVDGVIDPLLGGIYGFVPDASSGLNVLSFIGTALIAAAALLFALDLFVSVVARKGAEADANPWGGQSAEWLLLSPPPAGSQASELPELDSATPALDEEAADVEEAMV